MLTHRNPSVRRNSALNCPVAVRMMARDLPLCAVQGSPGQSGDGWMSGQEGVGSRGDPLLLPGSLDNETRAPFSDPLTHLFHTKFVLCHQQFAIICLLLLFPLLKLSSSFQLSAIAVASYRFHLIKFRKFVSSLSSLLALHSTAKRAFRIILLCSTKISWESLLSKG
jgi:hypothetical protein